MDGNRSLDALATEAALCMETPGDKVESALAAMAADPGALFEADVVELLRDIRKSNPARYARIRASAKAAKISLSELDRLTAADDEMACGMMFPEDETWPEPVDGERLLDDLADALTLYVVADAPTLRAAALWILHTWLLDVAGVSPIANVTSPEKRCGKTRLLEVLGKLAYRPITASNIAPAALYRAIETWHPTLLIDEVDSFLAEHEGARGILNSGFDRSGAYVIRCVGDDHTPTRFSTWGAKALCGIGSIADTLADRSITLRMRRKLTGEVVLNPRHSVPAEWDNLRSRIARWAADNREGVRRSRPAVIGGLHDRANDVWEPLRAIAAIAGGKWPDWARSAALGMSGAEDHGATVGTELLADIREVFAGQSGTRVFTVDLLAALTADEEGPWATWNRGKPMSPRQLSSRLKEFGIASADRRVGSTVRKGFDLDQFEDVFRRYLFPAPPSTSATELQAIRSNGFSGFSAATTEATVADENGLKGKPGNGCSSVAQPDPPLGEEGCATGFSPHGARVAAYLRARDGEL